MRKFGNFLLPAMALSAALILAGCGPVAENAGGDDFQKLAAANADRGLATVRIPLPKAAERALVADQPKALVNYYEVVFVPHTGGGGVSTPPTTPAGMARATGKVGEGALIVTLGPGKYDILVLAGRDLGAEKILLGTAFANDGGPGVASYSTSGTGYTITLGANYVTITLDEFLIAETAIAGTTGITAEAVSAGFTTDTVVRTTAAPFYAYVGIPSVSLGSNENVKITLPDGFFDTLESLAHAEGASTKTDFTATANTANVKYCYVYEASPDIFSAFTDDGSASTTIDTASTGSAVEYILEYANLSPIGDAAGTFYFDLTYGAFGLDPTSGTFAGAIDTWHIRNALYGDDHPDIVDVIPTPTKGGTGGAILLFFNNIGALAVITP